VNRDEHEQKNRIAIPMATIVERTITKKIISGRIITGNKRTERPTVMEANGKMQEI
jgi:hypothetical protein